jgi:hypothetical protein
MDGCGSVVVVLGVQYRYQKDASAADVRRYPYSYSLLLHTPYGVLGMEMIREAINIHSMDTTANEFRQMRKKPTESTTSAVLRKKKRKDAEVEIRLMIIDSRSSWGPAGGKSGFLSHRPYLGKLKVWKAFKSWPFPYLNLPTLGAEHGQTPNSASGTRWLFLVFLVFLVYEVYEV